MWFELTHLSLLGFLAILSLFSVKIDYKRIKKLSFRSVIYVWTLYSYHLILILVFNFNSYWLIPKIDILAIIIGFLLICIGTVFYLAGIIAFRSFKRMSGIDSSELIINGIYKWSWNPQNVGWGLFILGIAIIGSSLMSIILVGFFWVFLHIYVAYIEEPYLEEIFKDEYKKYRASTPRYFGIKFKGK
jgi:protein-S-isoprenylcysteine O-methyltransferase Ste14